MFSKLFGKKKESSGLHYAPHNPSGYGDWSFLGTDMHSHLIPGIDDGAETIEDSIMLIQRLQSMGFHSAITTPHIKYDHYPNNSYNIQAGLQSLQHALHERNINFPIRAAAEYYIDDHFIQLLEAGELMPIVDNQVLVEISFRIQAKGYKPILAHPERYAYYHGNMQAYNELRNRGCYLQLNVLSLFGYYGGAVKRAAEDLLAAGLYQYCGTDMHHVKHADNLQAMLQSGVMPLLQRTPFLNSSLRLV
jgi:protein-tyrosine phosphatase